MLRMVNAAARWLACLLALWAGPAPAGETLTVLVVSDLNGRYGSTEYGRPVEEAVRKIRELSPDLVISTGDMVAGQQASPRFRPEELRAMWAGFTGAVVQPLEEDGVVFVATPGNHDASAYPGFEAERLIYRETFAGREPPGLVDSGDYPFHYAFALGGVLFISLDVTVTGVLEPAQRAWLEKVIGENSDRYRARVVFGHLPIRAVNAHKLEAVMNDDGLETYLAQAGVDVYLSGHHHAFYPGVHGGLAQVAQACLGSGQGRLIGASGRSPRSITVLEFAEEGQWRVGALREPDFDEWVDIRALPESLEGPAVTLERLDLVQEGGIMGAGQARE